MSSNIHVAVAYVQTALRAAADPEKAAGMQAYMKTEIPLFKLYIRLY